MNIVVCGYGRAGKALINRIMDSKEHKLIGVLCRDESENAGKNICDIININPLNNGSNVKLTKISDAYENFKNEEIDVIIDFSNRYMATALIELCCKIKSNLIICTTNHTVEEIGAFEQKANQNSIGIVYAPNLTIGINLLLEFTRKLSSVFGEAGFEIIEKHPSKKPIPTATSRIIAQATSREDIPIHSIRLDGYVGVHELIVTDGIERLTICHESISREAFAKGALTAARFIQGRKGLFFMKDVIEELEVQ